MRNATILGRVDVPVVDHDYLEKIIDEGKNLHGLVKYFSISIEARLPLKSLYPNAYGFGLYATGWVGPHTDDGVTGDITLGIVIVGNHYLFTGNGRRVGDLVPGTVFALLNKKQHGAFQKYKNDTTPLVFAACEPDLAAEDWYLFCGDLTRAIHRM
jgi:hypothetical protein